MLFSELIDKILRKRNISARDLGEEIGVTGATISNILSGRIIKPQGETCKKILGYCQQYGIDTSELDWNEIVHLYFIGSKYASEYDWVSDVDESGTLKLRHKRCGRITTVPIMGLDGASIPCIFCWVDNYISKDAYTVDLNSDTTEYTIKHRHCRHVYKVTYEQIKQKKFRCPRCFGNGEGKNDDVDYGKRQDYRFITEPEKIIVPKKTEPEEYVFEDDDTPLDELSFESFLSSFKAHPRGTYSQELKDFGFEDAQMAKLVKGSVKTVAQIAELSFEKLKGILTTEEETVSAVKLLANHGYYLADYNKEFCDTIEDYLRKHMTCVHCGRTLRRTRKPLAERTCLFCQFRMDRLVSVKDSMLSLDLLPPENMSYSGGGTGFTIFITVTSNYKTPAKFELAEISLRWNEDKVVPDYNYRNHEFPDGYIFPECPRTFGKIWLTDEKAVKELGNGDKLHLSFKDKQDDSEILFVYAYDKENNEWRLYDYRLKTADEDLEANE